MQIKKKKSGVGWMLFFKSFYRTYRKHITAVQPIWGFSWEKNLQSLW